MKNLRHLILIQLSLAPCALLAQGSPPDSPSSSASLWQLISQGGWAMYPLGACSLILIYLIIHCHRETAPKNFGSEQLSQLLANLCREGKVPQALQAAASEKSLLARALEAALAKRQPDRPAQSQDSIDTALEEIFDLEENAVGQWIHYLSVIASVAPMIGLLGTVSGMIGAFQTMAKGGMGRPELLAGDIGEALITTATGLCIGIPAMIAFSYFSNRLNNQLIETSQQASLVTESLLESADPE